jgi:hypothetical protein
MRFLILWLTIIFVLASFGVGKALYHADNTQNIYELSSKIEWDESLFDSSMVTFTNETKYNTTESSIGHLKNVIFKGVNTMGFIGFEVARWGVELGYEYPESNYIKTMKLIVYLLIFMFVFSLFSVIVPILALIYLAYIGIKKIIKTIKGVRKK